MADDMKKPEGMGVPEYLTKRLLALREKIKKAKELAKAAAGMNKREKGGKETYYGMGKSTMESVSNLRRRQQESAD